MLWRERAVLIQKRAFGRSRYECQRPWVCGSGEGTDSKGSLPLLPGSTLSEPHRYHASLEGRTTAPRRVSTWLHGSILIPQVTEPLHLEPRQVVLLHLSAPGHLYLPPQVPSSPLAILSSKVLTMMPSGSEVASRAISFRTVLKNFLASGGWNSIFLKE